MDESIAEKTKKTAELYFHNVTAGKPYELWREFDKGFAKQLSMFVTGNVYAREVVPHNVRQLIAISALTVLGKQDELKLHIQAGLNVGCSPREITEAIFQTAVYGGVPAMNNALETLKGVLIARELWPLAES